MAEKIKYTTSQSAQDTIWSKTEDIKFDIPAKKLREIPKEHYVSRKKTKNIDELTLKEIYRYNGKSKIRNLLGNTSNQPLDGLRTI